MFPTRLPTWLIKGCILVFILTACLPFQTPIPSPTIGAVPTYTLVPEVAFTPSETPSPTETPTLTPSATPIPTDTSTPTLTPTITSSPTISPTPTSSILRGKVLEHSNCRYGPGKDFLYKYGILPDATMEVTGRDPAGTWLLIHSKGGDDYCWLRSTLMEVRGDVMNAPVVDPDIILPWSPYYDSLTGVSATRNGNQVTVFWNPLILKAGDDSLQTPYLIEAWVCNGGQIVFTVVGSYTTAAKVTDEPGCSTPSHGRVYAAEKHGYTEWIEIPWP